MTIAEVLCIEEGCGQPRYISPNGRQYKKCDSHRREPYRERMLAVRARERQELAAQTAETPPADETAPPRASDLPGVLAEATMMLARSQRAIASGEISALRIAVDSGAVRFHIGSERIGGNDHEP